MILPEKAIEIRGRPAFEQWRLACRRRPKQGVHAFLNRWATTMFMAVAGILMSLGAAMYLESLVLAIPIGIVFVGATIPPLANAVAREKQWLRWRGWLALFAASLTIPIALFFHTSPASRPPIGIAEFALGLSAMGASFGLAVVGLESAILRSQRWQHARLYRKWTRPLENGPVVRQFVSPLGVRTDTEWTSATVVWPRFQYYYRRGRTVLLFLNAKDCCVIRRRSFPSAEAWEQFLSWIETQVPSLRR